MDSVQAAIRRDETALSSSLSRMKGCFGSPMDQFHGVLNHPSKLRGGILPLLLDPKWSHSDPPHLYVWCSTYGLSIPQASAKSKAFTICPYLFSTRNTNRTRFASFFSELKPDFLVNIDGVPRVSEQW